MSIKDSGERTEFSTGAQRDMHAGKGRFDLLPWHAIHDVAKHCEEGAIKYGERNVDKGIPQHSFIDSAFRHLKRYWCGETDEPHLRAAAWNILWALEQETTHPDLVDVPGKEEMNERVDVGLESTTILGKAKDITKQIVELIPHITETIADMVNGSADRINKHNALAVLCGDAEACSLSYYAEEIENECGVWTWGQYMDLFASMLKSGTSYEDVQQWCVDLLKWCKHVKEVDGYGKTS